MYQMMADLKAFSLAHDPHIMGATSLIPLGATWIAGNETQWGRELPHSHHLDSRE